MTAWIRDKIANQSQTDTNSYQLPVFPDYETGDMLVVGFTKDTNAGGEFGTPSGWTRVNSTDAASNGARFAMFYKTNVTAGSETLPTVTSGDVDNWLAWCISVVDYDTTTPIEGVTEFDTGTSQDTYNISGITTTVDDCLVIYTAVIDNVGGPAIDGGGGLIAAAEGSSIGHMAQWDVQPTAGTSITLTMRNTDARRTGGFVFAIRPSGTADKESGMVRGGTLTGYIEGFHTAGAAATISAPSVSSVGGLSISDGLAGASITDSGIQSEQRCYRFSADPSATTFYGKEYTFSSALDLSSSQDKYLSFHIGPDRTKEEAWIGTKASLGYVVIVISGSGTAWRAWHVYAIGTDDRIYGVHNGGIVLDVNSTDTLLDSSGTFDATDVTEIIWCVHSVGQTSRLRIVRMHTMEPWKLLHGSPRDPARMNIIPPYQDGNWQILLKRQGARQWLVPALIQIGDDGTTDTYAAETSTSIEIPPKAGNGNTLLYHYADNAYGFIFRLAATDTLIWQNGSVAGDNAYRLEFPTNVLTNDVAQFSDWAFRGPGSTIFSFCCRFTDCRFNGRDEIEGNGAYFDGCLFTNSAGNSALTITLNSHLTARLFNCEFTNNNYGIELDVSNINQIVELNNVTFSGNTADIYIPATRTADITIRVNGGDTPTVQNDGSGAVTIENNVTIELTNLIAGSRVYIENTTDTAVLFNEIEATTTFSDTVNFTANKSLLVRIRNASSSPKYKPFETTGTLTSSGFSLVVNQELDE